MRARIPAIKRLILNDSSSLPIDDINTEFLATIKYTFTAYCDNCYPNKWAYKRVKKDVPRHVNVCPDCGNYLFWEKKVIGGRRETWSKRSGVYFSPHRAKK